MAIQRKESIFSFFDKVTLKLYLSACRLADGKRRRKEAKNIDKILILADLLLGDLGMSAHLIDRVRNLYQDATIVLICKEDVAGATEYLPVDYTIPVNQFSWAVLYKLKNIAPNGYPLVINIFSTKWLPILYGLSIGKVISHRPPKKRSEFMINEFVDLPVKPVSAVEIILNLLPASTDNFKLQQYSEEKKTEREKILLHIGASTKARLWPITLLDKIIDILTNTGVTELTITGLCQEKEYTSELSILFEKFKGKIKIINLIDLTNLSQLLYLIKNARCIIAVDTGVIHWARYFGTPNLSFLGQSCEHLFGAKSLSIFSKSIDLFVEDLPCRDKHTFHGIQRDWIKTCSKHTCPMNSTACLENIEPEIINKRINELLNISM